MMRDLGRFVKEYESIGDFCTFVAMFKYPQSTTETEYEKRLWQHLQKMHNADGEGWDPNYSSDPDDPHFAFSFNGCAFFVVGMHPGASRFSRRLGFPALIMNPESQIRKLKETGRLEHFAATVRARDTHYQGDINPSLPLDANSTGGESRVYSGKTHLDGDKWKCPFHAREQSPVPESKEA